MPGSRGPTGFVLAPGSGRSLVTKTNRCARLAAMALRNLRPGPSGSTAAEYSN
jgi:hypothetical protein